MRFICISDMHLLWENPVGRLDNLPEVQLKKLKFVLDQAEHWDASILQAGDFFDRPRSWSLLPIIIDLLRKYDVEIYCVFGQHDTYLYSTETRERTSLGILEKAGLVNILTDEATELHAGLHNATELHNIGLYGGSFGTRLPEFKRDSSDEYNIGVVHESISDAPLYPDHKFTQGHKFLMEHPNYDFILCGDIHRRFEFEDQGRRIVNTGPLMREEATEYNFNHKPSLYLLDTNSPEESEWIEIPHSPAEAVLSRAHIERREEAESLLDDFVGAIKEQDKGSEVSFQENLLDFIKTNNIEKEVVDVLSNVMQIRTQEEEI